MLTYAYKGIIIIDTTLRGRTVTPHPCFLHLKKVFLKLASFNTTCDAGCATLLCACIVHAELVLYSLALLV